MSKSNASSAAAKAAKPRNLRKSNLKHKEFCIPCTFDSVLLYGLPWLLQLKTVYLYNNNLSGILPEEWAALKNVCPVALALLPTICKSSLPTSTERDTLTHHLLCISGTGLHCEPMLLHVRLVAWGTPAFFFLSFLVFHFSFGIRLHRKSILLHATLVA